MNLRTFKATSMAQALQQVKRELGGDAVILHTRSYSRRKWMGLRKVEVVEITASNSPNLQARRRPVAAARPQPAPLRRPQPVAQEVRPGGLLQTPAATSAAMVGLTQEVNGLKSLVADLVRQTRAQQSPDIPQDLFGYYTHLIQNHVAQEIAADIMKAIQKELRPDQMTNQRLVSEKIAQQLEHLLPTAGAIVRTKTSGPHIVVLIGPTGVGKTTTLAKLAANLKLREKRRVGLITIDTYRIAAVDQLRKYAEIIGSQLAVVNSPEDLRQSIASMSDCEFVLIDTAGRSPSDDLKLNELKSFLAAAKPDEVHLVVSSTSNQECIERAIDRFGDVRVDKIIFTKIDEAVHVGVLLNVVKKVKKGLSYITMGQSVPDDIEIGQGRRLAQLILQDVNNIGLKESGSI